MSLPKATGQCDPEVMGCHLCHIAEHTAEDVLMIIKNLGGGVWGPFTPTTTHFTDALGKDTKRF